MKKRSAGRDMERNEIDGKQKGTHEEHWMCTIYQQEGACKKDVQGLDQIIGISDSGG